MFHFLNLQPQICWQDIHLDLKHEYIHIFLPFKLYFQMSIHFCSFAICKGPWEQSIRTFQHYGSWPESFTSVCLNALIQFSPFFLNRCHTTFHACCTELVSEKETQKVTVQKIESRLPFCILSLAVMPKGLLVMPHRHPTKANSFSIPLSVLNQ